VDTLLEWRRAARDRGDYATADAIRERLTAVGIELRDSPDGSTTHRSGMGEAAV
jgi:cysteinyl-tRNA synthetase